MKRVFFMAMVVAAATCFRAGVVTATDVARTDAPASTGTAAAPATSEKATGSKSETAAESSDLPTVDALMAQIDQKLKDVKDVSADVRLLGMLGLISGTIKAIPTDYIWMEISIKEKGEYGKEKESVALAMKTIKNKAVLYQIISGTSLGGATEISKTDLVEFARLRKEMADRGIPMPLDMPQNDYINYLKSMKEAEADIKVIKMAKGLVTLEVRQKGAKPRWRQEVTISTADGFVRSVNDFIGDQPFSTMEFSNYKINKGLKVEEFAYTPPAGVVVSDGLDDMRQAIHAKKAASEAPKTAPAESGSKIR